MTLEAAYRYGVKQLEQAGIENAEGDSWYLLEYVLKTDRSGYYLHKREPMQQEKFTLYEALLQKRAKHIPLQHLTGEQEFMGLPFYVNSQVLIPRQDTEILVERVLEIMKPGKRILDICTGSGCIIISLYCFSEAVQAVGADISSAALETAKKNAARNNAEVSFIESDLFSNIQDKFDVIVSNPPYIPSAEIEKLMPEVRDYEPRNALDGKGDGLEFYRRLVKESPQYLNPEGWLCLEIGYNQGESVCSLMKSQGFGKILVKKDLAGLDRVVTGQLLPSEIEKQQL